MYVAGNVLKNLLSLRLHDGQFIDSDSIQSRRLVSDRFETKTMTLARTENSWPDKSYPVKPASENLSLPSAKGSLFQKAPGSNC